MNPRRLASLSTPVGYRLLIRVAVVAADGEVKFTAASEEAAAFRWNWVNQIPVGSATLRALESEPWQKREGSTQTQNWFENSWHPAQQRSHRILRSLVRSRHIGMLPALY